MKKHADYRIDYITNTITVTRKFAEEASQLGTPAFATMKSLRELGMKIEIQTRRTSGKPKYKQSRLNYKQMEKFIACVENSEVYKAEFEAAKAAGASMNNAYQYVWSWFVKKFPNYNLVPEFDDDLKIVVTPADAAKEQEAA